MEIHMEYENKTKEELLVIIEELKTINKQLLEDMQKEFTLEFPWTGNLGHWYWNIKTNSVIFNPLKVTALGYSIDEIPEKVTYQYFTDKLHPDDYEQTMNAMSDHLKGKKVVYEIEYRIKGKDGGYKWYYDRGKITQYDEFNKPLLVAGIVFDITEKKNIQEELLLKNKQLFEQSYTDTLTKIKNRRYLIESLAMEINSFISENKPLSICIIDIDNFKSINDNYGHIIGDEVLRNIAEIMQKNVRKSDTAGRFGGEEFMIIFPDTDIEKARLISERIRMAVERHMFTKNIKLTISGGICECKGENIEDLIHCADMNLYTAKKTGKNKII